MYNIPIIVCSYQEKSRSQNDENVILDQKGVFFGPKKTMMPSESP